MAEEDAKAGSFRAAFHSWWVILGIMALSITGFRLLLRITHIHLAHATAYIVAQYHQLVHIPVWWFFQWVHLPKPPEWAVDVIVLWVLIGGIVLRSSLSIRASVVRDRKHVVRNRFYWRVLSWGLPFYVLFCLVAWPVAVRAMLDEPRIHTAPQHGTIIPYPYLLCRFGDKTDQYGADCFAYYIYDMRIVLCIQTLAAACAIIGWVAWNALAMTYGG